MLLTSHATPSVFLFAQVCAGEVLHGNSPLKARMDTLPRARYYLLSSCRYAFPPFSLFVFLRRWCHPDGGMTMTHFSETPRLWNAFLSLPSPLFHHSYRHCNYG